MAEVTYTTQLSVFDTIKSVLISDSTISAKFRSQDFFQYDPQLLSNPLNQFPYIVIGVPDVETKDFIIDYSTALKAMTVTITLVIEYEAREKVLTYANAIISSLESARSTFDDSGYYISQVDFKGSVTERNSNKTLIVSSFDVMFTFTVARG
jgi:hypothetical protein